MLAIRPQSARRQRDNGLSGCVAALLLACAAALTLLAQPSLADSTSAADSTAAPQAADTSSGNEDTNAHSGNKRINITPAQAARAARNVYGGRVLGVRLETDVKPPYYRVRLIKKGKMRVVRVTAHR